MNIFATTYMNEKAGLTENIDLMKYIDENRDVIDRYSIDKGKVKYDLDQGKMINDVVDISMNAFSGIGKGIWAMLHNDYNPDETDAERIARFNANIDNAVKDNFEATKIARDRIDEELSHEVSSTQSFVAGMAIHTMRQMLDPRQWAGLYASSVLGGGVLSAVPMKSKIGQAVVKGVASFTGETVEEATDEIINDNFDLATVIESGAGAVIINAVAPKVKKGVSKMVGLGKNKVSPDAGIKAEKAVDNAKKDYMNNFKNTGNEADVKLQDTTEIAKSTEAIAQTKGKTISAEGIRKSCITIEGTTVKEANEVYMPRIGNYIIKNKLIKGVKDAKSFNDAVEKNTGSIKEIISSVAKLKNLSDEDKEAFTWFAKILDEKRIKDVNVDAQKLKTATIDELDKRQEYKPIYKTQEVIEKGYPFSREHLDIDAFNERAKVKNKHNYKDYKKSVLEKDLRKDLKIPKNAKVVSVNGNIPKTPYNIKSNLDAEGNPVYVKKKWGHEPGSADIEWEHNGQRYFAKVQVIDGKWRGDIYSTDIPAKPRKTKIKGKFKDVEKPVKTISKKNLVEEKVPTNIMEDIYGKIDIDEADKEIWEGMKKSLARRFGLNKAVKDYTEDEIVEINRNIMKEIGRTVKRKYGFKNLDEMADFYKRKYGIEFSYKKAWFMPPGKFIPDQRGIATLSINTKTGKKKITIDLNDRILDEEELMGVFRHEIQHAIDYIKNPDFKAKKYGGANAISAKQAQNYLEYLERYTAGHFSGFSEGNWELSYLISNEIDSLFKGDKLDTKVLKSLGLEDVIPSKLDKSDKAFLKEAIEEGKAETDVAKRLKSLKTKSSNYFTIKRGLKNIYASSLDPGAKATVAKEFLRTNLLLPFQVAEEQMRNAMLKEFELNVNGNILGIEQTINLFEENGGNLFDVIFHNGKIPEALKGAEDQIVRMKTNVNKIIENLSEKGIAKPDDIINTVAYDKIQVYEGLLPEKTVVQFLDENKNFDVEKYLRGDMVKDPLTGKDISKKGIDLRELFAEKFYSYFNSDVDRLHHEFNRKKLSPKKIIRAIKEARNCMTLKDFENTLRKYKAEEIPEVRKFLEENPKLFQEIENLDIEGNLLNSKKKNAKLFFTDDMQSIKGADENAARGTFAHKLSRFVEPEYEGYISHLNVKKFVMANKVDQRLALKKLILDGSAAHAIKETFPKSGNSGLNMLLNQARKEFADSDFLTFQREIEGFIRDEIGEKLGLITKPSRAKIDRFFNNLVRYSNAINLTGPKALRELGQEPIGMARANVLLYGGEGFIGTYRNIMKATAILAEHGKQLEAINKSLGSKWKESIPLEFYNIIQDNLNDFTGYRKQRIAKYGSASEKAFAKLDKGLELVNLYSHTQRVMKLAAYFTGGNTLDRLTNFKTLDEALKANSHYTRRLFKDVEIGEAEYTLLKNFKNTESFKKLNIFDEADFRESLTLDKFQEVLGREITEEEFDVLRDNLAKKAVRLYDKIVSDISPTETTGASRAMIESIQDPITRNFFRLTANFKNSIREQWRRAVRDYYYSNLNEATGKFDWSNTVYRKRLMSNLLGTGMAVATIATMTDLDFYTDPVEYLSEKIDNLIDEPGSALWKIVQDQTNLWGLTTGSNIVRRPIQFAGQVADGEFGKATDTLVKWGIGTQNYNYGKFIYDQF